MAGDGADIDNVADLTGMRFTFEIDAGALRRRTPDELTQRLIDSGLDVSWTERRSGLFGIARRFTVEGSRSLVTKLIDELSVTIGWQPGPLAPFNGR